MDNKWIRPADVSIRSYKWICGACGRIAYYKPVIVKGKTIERCHYKYCPNCGVNMEISEDDAPIFAYDYVAIIAGEYDESVILDGSVTAPDLLTAEFNAQQDARKQAETRDGNINVKQCRIVSLEPIPAGVDERMAVCDDKFTIGIIDGFDFREIDE